MIYLDNNANTPLCDKARKEMIKAMDYFGNPSSYNDNGMSEMIKKHTDTLKTNLGAKGYVVFTSGATESNNMVANAFRGKEVLIGDTEHKSMLMACMNHCHTRRIPSNSDGAPTIGALKSMLSAKTAMVSIMAANNETGVVYSIREVVKTVKSYRPDIVVHVDASQIFGKMCNTDYIWEADIVTLSSHKMGGPVGIGALIVKDWVKMDPLHFGGKQFLGLRPGTESLMLIAGFAGATEFIKNQDPGKLKYLTDYLAYHLPRICDCTVNFMQSNRLLNTLSVTFPDNGIIHDKRVCISLGSACENNSENRTSRTLRSCGMDEDIIKRTARISLWYQNTTEELDEFLSIVKNRYPSYYS